MSHWLIEVENATPAWVEVPEGSVRSCSAGTNSDSQVIPDIALTFAADIDIPAGLLDPETNRTRARLRITDEDYSRYFRIEKLSGSIESAKDYPQISGRAWAGIITEFRPLTYDFLNDISASDMARLICTEHAASLTGDAVGVIWLAAIDPTIPGGRWQVSRRPRLELLRELVEMCGAKLRVSLDGLNFEVYDHPSRALSETATRTFSDAQSLNYELLRGKQPGNAVRVQGEQADYTRPTLPVVSVSVSPTSIDADGTSTADATATVYDSSGQLVQHKAVIDEAISAGSYTTIPVSGCYAVQAVWLNSGTQQSPVKGTRITPTSFDADEITVPTQATQLFIVSYTQAETVSWTLADQADEIIGEEQDTTGDLAVSTDNAIGRVIGVYRATDVNRSGTNFANGGSYTQNTTSITLGITPGPSGTAVIIDYETYNSAPLSASLGQSSSLCDAAGQATVEIGSGTTVGTAKITAAALSQEGSAWLSLLGSAIDSMELASDKAQILVGTTIEGQTAVSETNLTVHSEQYADGTIGFDGYVVVANAVAGSVQISSALDLQYAGYRYVSSEHRLYMRVTNAAQYFTFGTSQVDVSYNTTAEVENEAGTATITATVEQSGGSAVTDGTPVQFTLQGPTGAELSTTTAYTSGGIATTDLTAGGYTGRCYISAMCGSLIARLSIDIVRVVTDDDGVGTVSYPSGTDTTASGSDGDSGTSGDISGKRRLICDGVPHAGVPVSFDSGGGTVTDAGGYFVFTNAVTGSNGATATIDGNDYPFTFTC